MANPYVIEEDELIGPGVVYKESRNTSGIRIKPIFLVMHFTATVKPGVATNWLTNPASKVSAHIVLGRDGKIEQLLPFTTTGWHVGASSHAGYNGLNSHSIGIEIENYGHAYIGKKGAVARDPRDFSDSSEFAKASNWIEAVHRLETRRMYWERYTAAQLDALDKIVPVLVEHYKIREVIGHDDVAVPQGRKVDPGPAFPLDRYRAMTEHMNANSLGTYVVVADDLNMRGGPGTEFKIVGTLARGDGVKVLSVKGDWAQVTVDKQRAFVNINFLARG